VTAVDTFTYRGVEYILIEDSADLTFDQQKLITRNFLESRCMLARYPLSFKNDPVAGPKPRYDESVSSLQDCLTYEGLFPSNVTARGYYGSVTRQAVMDFQKKYGLEQVGNVGPKTNAKLKELYPL
jgi:murein L,D-transpeptidase YcbB/YkuD